ncbi:MAG: hypothetical protein MUE95_10615, partial [Cyclobacteriaceae bacterium]|nr:hypothetical protein [Cyclobacteriaceae bacterium]
MYLSLPERAHHILFFTKRLMALGLFLFLAISVHAQKTWLPTTGGSWATGANWSGGVAPVAGDVVIINSDQSANITDVPTISLSSLSVIGNCTLQAATSGNTITVTGSFVVSSGKTLTIGVTGGRLNFTLAASGSGTVEGTAILNAGGTARTFLVNGNLSIPSGGLLSGAGTSNFTLAAGGTLQIGSANGIATTGATGSIQVTGTRTYSTAANYIFIGNTNQITGAGLPATVSSLTINNTGGGGNNTVDLSGSVTISNALTGSSGNLNLGANNILNVASVSLTGTSIGGTGTLTLGGDITTNASANTATISAPVALTGTRTLTVADGTANPDLLISSAVSGAFGLIKQGAGTYASSGTSTYSGGTTLTSGRLHINSTSAIGSGTLIINGGALDNSSGGPITLSANNAQNWNADFSFDGSNNLNLGTGAVTITANTEVTAAANTL